MSSKKTIVFIKIIGNSDYNTEETDDSDYDAKNLNLNDYLSDIRRELESWNIINDVLLFSKKENSKFSETEREKEEDLQLRNTITVENSLDILYLQPHREYLCNQHKLGYGRIINSDKIEKAEKQACTININKYEVIDKSGQPELQSKEGWKKEINSLVDDNVMNFTKLVDKNFNGFMSAYECKKISKVSLKFSEEDLKLNLTDSFKEAVDNVKSCKPEEFPKKIMEIIKDYGQFIPTEIILGGRAPDDKTSEQTLIKSLNDYQNWECIEFRNPISIFKISIDLHEKAFESIGKKILYDNIELHNYVSEEFQIFDIPKDGLYYINNENDRDCDVFASVIDTNENSRNVFFNCQILRESIAEPRIIIHKIPKKNDNCTYKLKIRIMVIGYDIKFEFLDKTSVKLKKDGYDPRNSRNKNDKFLHSITLQQDLLAESASFFGIPVLENFRLIKSFIIGYNFRNFDSRHKIEIFSYCLNGKWHVGLPKVTFCTLIVLTGVLLNSSSNDSFNSGSEDPKFVSLCINRNDKHKPFLFSQKINQINIEYLECKHDLSCDICKEEKKEKILLTNVVCKVY